ncbi:hypothetical protein CP97_06070 [Aurantiacibacter atlanticus]|uniref:Uncharacterized protein n=1 Tax=Aurantiacibacter atlanticus TaxID=1648404 RepID=A0A0H4VX89_9SPHN|nr:polysaccharide biosynthesis/export family protein [Aurantiacibacter atlanticus]AKQ41683.2 hypothetical protein CP97_06070 [Aurantiacibacter atlanticus]MDF1833355.1 polysaccharide biosynthesis/export family protein [Alteraurantiacibacter sp. bin_em_oilr2.035]
MPLIFCGLLAACSSGLDGLPPLSSASSDYVLQPGDKLEIGVQSITDATGTYELDGNGKVSLPLLQDLQLGGLTLRAAERAIADGYREGGMLNNPVVTVQPAELRPFYVIGEVNRPGEYPYRQGMTILSAVAAAGGYTYRAHEREVEVVRSVDGRDVRMRAGEDVTIQPGDRIRIYERWF